MPTVARIGPYRFFFYGNESNEPVHIHVQRDSALAKYWLSPVALAASKGFAAHELSKIESIVRDNEETFRKAWDEFFNR